jgi:uncharacterized phage protein gp47/JayE
MSFAIPTLAALADKARKSLRAYLKGTDAWIWPNNMYVAAKVMAGVGSEITGFAANIQKQMFALTATDDSLANHGSEVGLTKRPAAPASGIITLTVPGAVVVAAAAVFSRGDGFQYLAAAATSLPGAGNLDVAVIASVDGKAGNAIAGTPINIVSGVTGTVTSQQVGTAGITAGDDVEDDGEPFTSDLGTFRGRILFRKRNPPSGGAPSDYVLWGTAVSGVTRIFVERRWIGAGTVRVFVLMDTRYPNGIPSDADVARVADAFDLVAPAGASVTTVAPIAHPIDVTITGLQPNNATVQKAIGDELTAAFLRLSAVAGNDTPNDAMPYLATPQSFSKEWISQAIGNAVGQKRHVLLAPSGDTALDTGEIATLGNLSFI